MKKLRMNSNDAAAEAVVREIDVPRYIDTGDIRFSGDEYAMADQ